MLRLYGSAKSRALRNLWLLAELDVPYDHKDDLPGSPETRTPEFRASCWAWPAAKRVRAMRE